MSNYMIANAYVKANAGGGCNFPDLWDMGRFALIKSDNIATKMLDMAEMFGVAESIKMLQNVLNEPLEENDEHFSIDGKMTQGIADAISMECKYPGGEFALLAALVSQCEDRINDGPEQFLTKERLDRAMKLP